MRIPKWETISPFSVRRVDLPLLHLSAHRVPALLGPECPPCAFGVWGVLGFRYREASNLEKNMWGCFTSSFLNIFDRPPPFSKLLCSSWIGTTEKPPDSQMLDLLPLKQKASESIWDTDVPIGKFTNAGWETCPSELNIDFPWFYPKKPMSSTWCCIKVGTTATSTGTSASRVDCCCCFKVAERSLDDPQGCCCCCLPQKVSWPRNSRTHAG